MISNSAVPIAFSILIAIFVLPPKLHAAEPPSSGSSVGKNTAMPAAVSAAAEEMRKSCREVDGKPASKDSDFIESADLTGDGFSDYVLDQANFVCDGAASLFSGTAGSELSVFVTSPAGTAAVVWDGYVYGHDLERSGPRPILYVSVSGAACGQKNAASRADETACQRPLQWDAGKKTMAFAPASQTRAIKEQR